MIISHRHRFIFLKTLKTASTSIEIALSKHCGPEDTITRMFVARDEELRRSLGYPGPQHYVIQRGAGRQRIFPPHTRAATAKQYFPSAWASYFKFCVVRNPWEVCASTYAAKAAKGQHGGHGFSEFIASESFAAWVANWRNVYSIDGRIAVDELVRYEDLADGLEKIRVRVGLPEPLALPRAKSGYRKGHYREMVNERDAEVIARLFAPEVEMFGYRY